MALTVYNSLGKTKQPFTPLHKDRVGFYGCGPTVYNYAHIGNLRAYVFHDTVVKTLRFLGYRVKHVMNITDIGHLSGDTDDGEDKMVKTAQERGQSVLNIAAFYTQAFFTDTERLGIVRPDIVCKATEHIDDMIALIKRLEARGHTYTAGGNVYYDVSTFPEYGAMAGLNLDELKAGARIATDSNKRSPHDFVLWFTQSKFENHALTWDSPWGRGYPGWHIECSAMSMKYLGEAFDIHAGGIDHTRVHHTNEIAQSEGATGKQWVRYWLHNEFLVMNKDKMSKSLGNIITLQTLIDQGFDPMDYRYFLLSGHYRSQLSFSFEALTAAQNARKNIAAKIMQLHHAVHEPLTPITEKSQIASLAQDSHTHAYVQDFLAAIEDDFSTPQALSVVHRILKDKTLSPKQALSLISMCDSVLSLNLLAQTPTPAETVDTDAIEAIIAQRSEAKKHKDYATADRLRDELKAKGIMLEDTPSGTIWKKL